MKATHGIAAIMLVVALAAGGVAFAGSEDTAGDGDDTPTAEEHEGFDGLALSDAVTLAEEQGRVWRISRQDGEVFALTADLLPGRVTFEVDDGIVTSSSIERPSTPADDDPAPEDPARARLLADALRRLATGDNGFGARDDVFDEFRVATVIGADADRALLALDRELIAAALSDLGTVRFIDDADTEIAALFDQMQHGVAVLAVDDLLLLDDSAEITLRLWCGSLCAVFLTYEAVPDGDGWRIIGTKGPIAMS